MSLWIRLCNHTYIHTYKRFSLKEVQQERSQLAMWYLPKKICI